MRKVWRIIDLVKWGEEFLSKKAIESPRLSMELLICKVLDLKRIDLYLKFDQPLLKNELEILREYVKRLSAFEPIQYIIGSTDFYGLKILTKPGILIPRPETEELCKIIVEENKKTPPESILDIGTGSGCLALALAKNFPESEVYAIDVSMEALKIAEENQRLNKVSNVKFFNLNILEKKPRKKFPLIVSNPPYISIEDFEKLEPNVREFEPKIALSDGNDGMDFYRFFAKNFKEMLLEGGKFFIELNEDATQKINRIFEDDNSYNYEIKEDMGNKNRFLIGEKL